ncbi:hypothetical protein J1G44_12485 [Cellulomonas sp. zg-ZUI199]|uniref:Bacterial spore germination immunoglobulin-like domain-containing protein n=1 Tax=Cellulomonas wangleii TaxID=2816956 RepID=A0ABX8D149_9CELL|nr:hypothetical protein [Cellulomonas wangleii]MBO0925294.1 hypothetical protein [Cellulomonas wangleii]QVI61207.1 hypothetical protein KG103_11940 [Cellulomonas wangleii]
MPRTPSTPGWAPGRAATGRRAHAFAALLLVGTLAATTGCSTGTPGDGAATPVPTASTSASPSAGDEPAAGTTPGADDPAGTDPEAGGADAGTGDGTADGPDAGADPGTGTVPVVLTIAAWAGDRAVVSGYAETVESGGTCRATLTRPGTADVVVEAPAVPDVATTSCSIDVPAAQLTAGAWTVTLRYVSGAHEGAAEPTTLEVPA